MRKIIAIFSIILEKNVTHQSYMTLFLDYTCHCLRRSKTFSHFSFATAENQKFKTTILMSNGNEFYF